MGPEKLHQTTVTNAAQKFQERVSIVREVSSPLELFHTSFQMVSRGPATSSQEGFEASPGAIYALRGDNPELPPKAMLAYKFALIVIHRGPTKKKEQRLSNSHKENIGKF